MTAGRSNHERPMPAPQLHLTFGELLVYQSGIPLPVREAISRDPSYARLGSVFHDLPYYGNMIAETIRYGLCRPAIDASWAYRVHSLRPDLFALNFIEAARRTPGLSESERTALVGGMLSHCALDLTLHPLANYCARRDEAIYGGHETYHHRMAEKYQALFFHVERFGEDIIGTPAFAKKTILLKRVTLLGGEAEAPILRLMDAAYRATYGDAPSAKNWTRWVRNFRHFGLIVGGLAARRNSKRKRQDESLRRRYYCSNEFNFDLWYVLAEQRALALIDLGYAYFKAGDFSSSARAAFLASAGIDDLVEPAEHLLPKLPALPQPPATAWTTPRALSALRHLVARERMGGHAA